MKTSDRLAHLAACASLFQPWTGRFDREELSAWLTAELGDAQALDQPVPYGGKVTLARAAPRVLHVVSQNTPHAAFQSLLRGLVVGSHNTLKIPSAGLPAFTEASARLPRPLSDMVELIDELPDDWREHFEAVVVFGNDDTLRWFRQETPSDVALILHGPKLSIGVVSGDWETAARLAARDVSRFDQRGCLSIHDVYVTAGSQTGARDFGELLAQKMQDYEAKEPRATLTTEESGAIAALREEARYLAATDPSHHALWECDRSTAWTVVYEASSVLRLSPLNRVVFVKPWPQGDLAESLGSNRRYLSTIALHPRLPCEMADLISLGATRLCPLGTTQDPPVVWHHDGIPPLASLVSWIDLGA